VAWELSSALAEDAILTGDAGTVAYWINRCIRMRGEQRFSLSGLHCTMGSGISYAIGAQCAFPGRQVVAFVGDGAAAMVLSDLATLVQHKLPVKVIVLKNGSVMLERWEQTGFLGNPEFGNDLSDIDFRKAAEAFGLHAVRIEDPAACGAALREALARPGPALVECVVDPNEPAIETPLAGKHAENYGKAVERGTEDAEKVAQALLQSLREEQRFVPEAIDEPTAELMTKLESYLR
jgi:pyruvate dehydrogenase (quinone)